MKILQYPSKIKITRSEIEKVIKNSEKFAKFGSIEKKRKF